MYKFYLTSFCRKTSKRPMFAALTFLVFCSFLQNALGNPTAPLLIGYPLCANESYKFTAQAGLNNIQWQKDDGSGFVNIAGATNTVYNATSIGKYRYIAQDDNGCDVIQCDAFELISATCIGYPLCPSESYKLTAQAGLVNIQWQKDSGSGYVAIAGATNAIYNATSVGKYKYTAKDANDCTIELCTPFEITQGVCNTGSISGKAFTDKNSSGIQDIGDTPLANTVVTLKDNLGNVAATSTTDAAGNYTFGNLTAGAYTVSFPTQIGFLPTDKNVIGSTPSTNSDINNNGETDPITLSLGQSQNNIDGGFKPSCTEVASIAGSTTVCDNNLALLSASAGVSYLWSNAATTKDINVGEGTYAVTITYSNGCTSVANKTVVKSTSTTYSICPGESYTLTAQSGLSNIQWQKDSGSGYVAIVGANATTYNATSVGKYKYTATDGVGCAIGLCCAFEIVAGVCNTATIGDYVFEDVNKNGIQDAGDLPLANVSVILKDNLGNVVQSTTSDSNGNYSFTNVAAGTYKVQFVTPVGTTSTVKNAVGSTAANDSDVNANGETDSFTITQGQTQLNIDAGFKTPCVNDATITGNTTVCTGKQTTLTAGAGASFLWNNTLTTQSIEVGAGTYTVTITKADGCKANKSITVTEDNSLANFAINASAPQLTCSISSITLSSSPSSGLTYQWSDGSGSNTYVVNSIGTYTVTATNANGCTAVASIVIGADNSSATANIYPKNNQLTCIKTTVTLKATGGTSYVWSDGSTSTNLLVSTAGTYSVTATNANGCSGTASVTVTEDKTVPAANIASTNTELNCNNPTSTLTATGGNTYLWSNGNINPSITVSTGGTYSVTATGSNGCTAVASETIIEDKIAPTASISVDNAILTCENPSATLTIVGTGGVTYTWNNGSGSYEITVTTGGIYTVTVTGDNGCTAVATTTITVDKKKPSVCLNPLTATLTCKNPSITITETCPQTNTFDWSNGSSGQSITVTTPGIYFVTVTAANGCTAVGNTVINEDKTLPNASITPSIPMLNCANPTATLTVSGNGTYVWDNGSTDADREVSSMGTYSATVTGANGCTATAVFTMMEDNTQPIVNITPKNGKLTCTKKSVTLRATGGVTYLWEDGSTNSSLNVSSAGTYTVTATGTNGCTAVASVNVTEDKTEPIAGITASNIILTCKTPSATLTATGGGTYLWSNGNINPTITVNAAGTYSVTVTGANGCTAIASTTITEDKTIPTATISADYTTLTCKNPSAILEVSSLVNTNYVWSNGVTSTTNTIFSAGTYSVTATNTNGCSVVESITVVENKSVPIAKIITLETVLTCKKPIVTLTAQGGSLYRFAWSTGGGSPSTNVTTPGYYTVTVTGANGCTAVVGQTVTEDKTEPIAGITASNIILTCKNPTATLTATGTGTYTWSNGNINPTIAVNTAGTYSVTVTGSNGCTAVASTTITEDKTIPTAAISADYATLTCKNSSAVLTATGGDTYNWSNGSTNSSITVTSAGTYFVTVTNANGCTAQANISIFENKTIPTVNIWPKNAQLTCSKTSVTLNTTTGDAYLWSNGATTKSTSVTSAGVYSVTITNANGCSNTSSVTVTEDKTIPTANATSTNSVLTCKNPSATLTATGGGTYNWSNNTTGSSISVVAAGTYTVTVTGTNGCTATASVVITEDKVVLPISITPSNLVLTCKNPSAVLSTGSGSSYMWSTGATTPNIIVTTPGTYYVTATSSNGCSILSSVVITEDKAVPTASITSNNSVLTCKNPSATLTATGGGTYSWSNNTTGSSISVTTAGTYTVTVTSANGCTAVASATVTEDKATPTADIKIQNNGSKPGTSILTCAQPTTTLLATGGGTYLWSNGSSNATQLISVAGTYKVTVSNVNGCTAVASIVVTQDKVAPIAKITSTTSVLTCTNSNIVLNASGGGTYLWSNNATTNSITANTAGTYSVTVTGKNGCTSTSRIVITENKTIPKQCVQPLTGTLTCTQPYITVVGIGGGTYKWSNGATTSSILVSTPGTYYVTVTTPNGCTTVGQSVISEDKVKPTASVTPKQGQITCNNKSVTLTASGSGTYNWGNNITSPNFVASQAGTYTVTVTGANGCTSTASAVIVQNITAPTVTISPSNPVLPCNGTSVTLTATGGATYAWSNGLTGASITTKKEGTYTVTVTNANGCKAVKSITVLKENCNTAKIGDCVFEDTNGNGIQDLTEKGVPNITVSLSGTTTQTTVTDANGKYLFSNLPAGTYSVNFVIPSAYKVTLKDKGNDDTKDSDIDASGKTQQITLSLGQNNLTIDAGIYKPACLGDFVFVDANRNGIQDPEEVGLSGITVQLFGTLTDGSNVVLVTTTNTTGYYKFPSLAIGTYYIKINSPAGFILTEANVGADDTKDSDIDPITGKSQEITLISNQQYLDLDAGLYNKFQNVCANDVTKPVFQTIPNNITIECNTSVPQNFTATAVDNCTTPANITISYVDVTTNGICPVKQIITRTWTAKDQAGNTAQATGTITTIDTKAPVITGVPANITITCGLNLPAMPTGVKAMDNCDGDISTTLLFSEKFYVGPCVSNGTTSGKSLVECTWTAKDACGNIATKIWTITVIEGTISKVQNDNNNEVLTQKNVDKAIVEEEKIDKELNTILEARAYPNPSNGIFTVDFGTYNVTKLIVFDMSGRAIYNETFSTKQDKVDLSLTNQKVGMYSIFMQTTQGVITKRIFIVN